MDLRLFCLFFVCLSLPGLGVNGGEIRNITARGYWKRIFEEVNSAEVPTEYTVQYFHGVKLEDDDESSVTVKGSGPIHYGLSEGDRLKILSIDFGIEGQRKSPASFRNLKEAEIHGQREHTIKFTVQPGQKIVKWQFVVDIAGNEYHHNQILTYANDKMPEDFDVTVTLVWRKLIRFGSTRIRIRHQKSKRYLTMVKYGSYPAATLGDSRYYYFILYNYGRNGVAIKTLNSMVPGYDYLHVWSLKGAIYGYTFQRITYKYMYWAIGQALPLYGGDEVTFMNEHFHDSYLCNSYVSGTSMAVSICQHQEDEWILEVV